METETKEIIPGNHLVCFADGSCLRNPGNGGYGVFGYIYRYANKSKNIKHPSSGHYLTTEGIHKERNESLIEVTHVLEVITALCNPRATNNEAELKAFLTSLTKASEIEELKSVTIYSDSNYVIASFNEGIDRWKNNNWKRQDGKPIVHRSIWENIEDVKLKLLEKSIEIKAEWVKGHSDNIGNNLADLYSNIGSNSSKQILSDKDTIILEQVISYQDYSKGFGQRDFIYYFKELYFTSDHINDTNYCFISSSEDPTEKGKRNNASIFATIIGDSTELVNQIKSFYRNEQRGYITTCCADFSKLQNKDIFRLLSYIDLRYFLVKLDNSTAYGIIKESGQFLYETSIGFPYVVSACNTFNRLKDIAEDSQDDENEGIYKYNITDSFIKDNKLLVTNKDKFFDFTELTEKEIRFKQRLIIKFGYDIPSYLALKNIEKEIKEIYLIVKENVDSNLCSVFINIVTDKRNIHTINVENKYVIKTK